MPVTHQAAIKGVRRNVTTELSLKAFTDFEAICKHVGMSKAQYLRKLIDGVIEASKKREAI